MGSLSEGGWSSDALEELTAAMAAVSTMRGSQDEETSAAATWTVARSIEFAVDQVPFEDYTEAMKENLAVVVANTAEEGVHVANGGYPRGLGLYRDDDSKNSGDANSVYTTLIYRVIDNQDAAATISKAFVDAAIADYSGMADAGDLGGMCQNMGNAYGYLNAIGVERMTDIAGADAEFDNPIPITRSILESQAYAEAVNRGLFTDPDAFNSEYLQDEFGEPYSWYSTGADGTTAFNLDNPPTRRQSIEVHNWADDVVPTHDPEGVFMHANRGLNTGISGGQSLIYGRDGAGGYPGSIQIEKD
ncbi:DUF6571 family protein [Actinomyces ruminis]|uniref:DUF6571 domain-containing protein n=1 Tax=Actinomyces ruminis TaxID=1937003 RepID=A0ABX4MD95_9ACTO|nr:DUF6571 family protein [Actinomyces ruminis]PHP53473.1 hypothetical protein BW737_002465 [Actinomyces ruminis]